MADPGCFYPQKMARIILLAMEEIIGHNGVTAVLNQAGLSELIDHYPPNTLDRSVPFETLARLQGALEQLYGPRGGRGIALRVGRATFKYGLREFGPLLGFTDLAFRLMPQEERVRQGAENFAEIFNRFTDQLVVVEETPEVFLWKIERCPLCWQRQTDGPACHLAVGLIQEALYWVTGGKIYNIEEIACISAGDSTCTIRIDKVLPG
jgi:predicted hydrocarbon binding protein